MDKAIVFAIMGGRRRTGGRLERGNATEKWQSDLANLKTRIITFKEGKVVKVDEFQIGSGRIARAGRDRIFAQPRFGRGERSVRASKWRGYRFV
jgi:hypothetical protein